jgi:lipopolysaccharide/colanic/teichoic acid biosynthesis glycosyltransferase
MIPAESRPQPTNLPPLAQTTNGLWVSRRPHWKRALDLVAGSVALVLLLPVMAILALWVRLDSPGPILFAQERVGIDARPFRMWKFRSMYVGMVDDRHREAVAAWFAANPGPEGYKSIDDPRITRVGRVLRRFSLDELPQLFNVMQGEMSLVGPRPAIAYELVHYQHAYFERFRVPPGMTGLWQVSGRDRTSAPEMMELDIEYVRRLSLALDLWIMTRTLPALLGR